jgi:GNAT superfamily N-acetyltransferase
MVQLEIRRADRADEAFLWEMLYLALFVPAGGTPLPREMLRSPAIARYVEGWGTRDGDEGYVALVAGSPVGAAWMRRFSASDPGYGFVDDQTPELSVAVLPEYRGHGIGTRLVAGLLESATAISLSCDPRNPAFRLYLRLGFAVLEDQRTMVFRNAWQDAEKRPST